MDVIEALTDAHGAARFTELVSAGVRRADLDRCLSAGRVVRAGHGTYALPWAEPAVVLAVRFRATIGCVTACEHWGLPLWDGVSHPHLMWPPHGSAAGRDAAERRQVTLHCTSAIVEERWAPVHCAVDQAARCTSPLGQLVLVDAALHAGLILPGDVRHFTDGTVRRREWLQRAASGWAESPLETVTRCVVRAAGLSYREQVYVEGAGRVDLLVEDQLVVESDGWEFHRDRDAFERDRDRDRVIQESGLRVVRFTSRQLRRDLVGAGRSIARLVGREPDARLERRVGWAARVPGGR